MKTSTRPSRRRLPGKSSEALPGVHGTARVDRRVATLLPRLRPGDVAVVDVLDLDKATAQALAHAGVAAVVDASDLISGRFPNLGPELLHAAGIALVDRVGVTGLAAVKDGSTVRLHDGAVHVGDRVVASGRVLDGATIEAEMASARRGMTAQLQSFTHNSSEFLRREQGLLLHGSGLPTLRTSMAGRPVMVVSDPHELATRRRSLRPFIREQDPVLVGVDSGADALVSAGLKPHVVVVTASGEAPSAKAIRAARDVVLVVEPGGQREAVERLERLGARPLRLETTASAEDAALLLADAGEARVIVTVGARASLEEFLDRGRSGVASTYLTRLKVGTRLVDAGAVPTLYSGRVRPRHVLLALMVCVVLVVAAIASTPVGQEWAQEAWAWIGDAAESLRAWWS
jgi:uncharacterized membrane-anchored protein